MDLVLEEASEVIDIHVAIQRVQERVWAESQRVLGESYDSTTEKYLQLIWREACREHGPFLLKHFALEVCARANAVELSYKPLTAIASSFKTHYLEECKVCTLQ